MKKRILIFSTAYFPYVGGAEIAIREITDRIEPSDIEFHLITNRFDSNLPRMEKMKNIWVYRVGWGRRRARISDTYSPLFYLAKVFFVPIAAWKAYRLHRECNFDGAWAMMIYMLFPITLLRFFGVRIPYAVTLQEGDPFEHVFRRWYILPFRPLLRYGFRHASAVQAISGYLAEWAVQNGFTGKVAVIPNGATIMQFGHRRTKDEAKKTREELGIGCGDMCLITTSRLVKKNAIDTVIRAMPMLPDRSHFVIAGTGPQERALRKLAHEQGVGERVHFLGHVDHADIPTYLCASNIFVRPSRSEGMGSSFVEAMAAGLPVIGTQVGGITDFLFDAKRNPEKPTTGWAVDIDSPEQIAESIADIETRPEHAEHIVKTARALVHEEYDWDNIARSMHERVFIPVVNTRVDGGRG